MNIKIVGTVLVIGYIITHLRAMQVKVPVGVVPFATKLNLTLPKGIAMKHTMDVLVTRDSEGRLEAWITSNRKHLKRDVFAGEKIWERSLRAPETMNIIELPEDWFPEITKDSEPVPMTLTLEEKP